MSRRAKTLVERHEARKIVAKLRQLGVPILQDRSDVGPIRKIGVAEVTCPDLRQEFSGRRTVVVERMKEAA